MSRMVPAAGGWQWDRVFPMFLAPMPGHERPKERLFDVIAVAFFDGWTGVSLTTQTFAETARFDLRMGDDGLKLGGQDPNHASVPANPDRMADVFGRHFVKRPGHFHATVEVNHSRTFPETREESVQPVHCLERRPSHFQLFPCDGPFVVYTAIWRWRRTGQNRSTWG